MRFAHLALFGLIMAMPVAASAASALENAIYAGVAAQKCELDLTAEQSSLLGDVVQRAEQASGLDAGAIDAIWSKANGEADADAAGFCAAHAKTVDTAIAAP